jgi:probable HAF family extracellular repeat protein
MAINNAGDVVGTSFLVEGGQISFRAFLWRNGVMKALPLLPNDQFSQAFAVNDRGQVAGISLTCDPFCTDHLVVWDGDDVIEIAGFEEFGFKNATGINNRGQVVGTRQFDTPPFISRGYLAEPH